MSSRRGTRRPAIAKADLVTAANTLLTGLSSLHLAAKSGADDAFEYWLWARTISAARGRFHVELKGVHRGRVRLRTSPSHITSGAFSHAEISSPTGAVELHTGVYVAGGSKASHELDVVAIRSGARRIPLERASLQWGFEAKLHAATLRLSIPRAVLGTAYDLGTLPAYGRGPPRLALVSSAPVSSSGRLLLAHRQWGYRRVPAVESVAIGRTATLDAVIRDFLSRI
jgi:hypothetical protein